MKIKMLGIALLSLSLASQAAVFSEDVKIDKVENLETGHCQIRQAARILKDGVEIAKSFHRFVIEPEGDLSSFDKKTQAICKAAWDPATIKKFKADRAKRDAELAKGIPK
jgi:hypothetical protein